MGRERLTRAGSEQTAPTIASEVPRKGTVVILTYEPQSMRRIGSGSLSLAVLLLICFSGCDTNKMQDEFANQAFSAPNGFTHTDANGQVLKDNNGQPLVDPDDWRIGPGLPPPAIDIEPAYPNPAPQTGQVYVRITLRFADIDLGGALIIAEPAGTRIFNQTLAQVQVTGVGTYVLNFPAGLLGKTGLHRLVVVSGRGEIVTYGDVNVQ